MNERQHNTERFTGRADLYDRYRQRYSGADILPVLRNWTGLEPDWNIADIGAGTGMLTEVFLTNGNPVIAVEPNAEMLAACERLATQWPALKLLKATAESTTLADGSIDMVTAGRALHWFDVPRAVAEFRRILKPEGWLTLISLGRAKDETPQSQSFESLLKTFGTDYQYVRAGHRIHDNLHDVFPGPLHQTQIHGEEELDWQSFLGQTLSLSVVPHPNDENYIAFRHQLRDHFDRFAVEDQMTQPTTCWVSAGQLKPAQLSTR